MTDMLADPYAGAETEEERQVVYQRLLQQYEQDIARRNREIYDEFSEQWKDFREVQLNEDEKFEKIIASFSAGAFGVSFAFINAVIPLASAAFTKLLFASWVCFGAALILLPLYHLISSFIHSAYCDDINANMQRGFKGVPYKEYHHWYGRWVTNAFVWLCFACFVGGLVCLLLFILFNV